VTEAEAIAALTALLATAGRAVFNAALAAHGYRRVEEIRPTVARSTRAVHEILGDLAAAHAPAATAPVPDVATPPAAGDVPASALAAGPGPAAKAPRKKPAKDEA
jgi:hypothetical protein